MPPRPLLRRVGSILFWVLAAVYIPVCILLITLKWWVLPELDRYQPRLESALSQRLGVPVEIGSLSGSWVGLNPQIHLQSLQLSASGQAGFSLASARADISLLSLLAFTPRFDNLELFAPVLQVERLADGRIAVAGFPIEPDGSDEPSPLVDFLLKQRRVLLANASLEWADRQGELGQASLEQLTFLLENRFGRHRAGLRFEWPALARTPFEVQADFRSPLVGRSVADPMHWAGQLYANFLLENTQALKPLISRLGLQFNAEQPQGQMWLDFADGEVEDARLDLRLAALRLESPQEQAQAFELENASTTVKWQGRLTGPGAKRFELTSLQGVMHDGQPFGPTDALVEQKPLEGGATAWAVRLLGLDAAHALALAEDIAPHAGRQDLLSQIAQFELAGQIERLDLSWTTPAERPFDTIGTLGLDLAFQNLSVLHRPAGQAEAKPTGFSRLSGQFKGDDKTGQWALSGQDASLHLPSVFEFDTLALQQVQGRGTWLNLFKVDEPLQLLVESLTLSNPDIELALRGQYNAVQGETGDIQLEGDIVRAQVAAIHRYLPRVVGPQARAWVGEHLKAGVGQQGKLALQGKLSDFPFASPQAPGLFRVQVPVTDGELTFAPEWPALQKVQADVLFEGKRMEINASSAQTLGVPLQKVKAVIDNLDAWEPVLEITGNGVGGLDAMLNYVRQSPVELLLNRALESAQGQGDTQLELALQIPLNDVEKTTVQGKVQLSGNLVRIVPSMPEVSQATGAVLFTERGLQITDLSGQALGGPLQVQATTSAQGNLEIRASGTARAAQLAQYLNPLAQPYLSGLTPFTVVVATAQNGLSVQVDSSLQGLEVKLPEPLGKSAEARLPFRLQQIMQAQGDRWSVDLGSPGAFAAQLRAITRFNSAQQASQLESLQFAVGAPISPPLAGIQGEVRVGSLNLDTWRTIYSEVSNAAALAEKTDPGLMGVFLSRNSSGQALKTRVGMRTAALSTGSKRFENVAVVARTVENRWQFDIQAKGIDGYFTWLQDTQRPEGSVLARFETLEIPKSLDDDMRQIVEEPVSSIPALDIMVNNFTLSGKPLGRLQLLAVNQSLGQGARRPSGSKEWRLEKLVIDNPESTTEATGTWQYGDRFASQQTNIAVKQTVRNAGGLLRRLGMEGVFAGGEGELEGRLRWNDAPSNMDYATLGGEFKLTSRKGQFLKADPGVAKLLGVLSLQGIPRRFALDFKDVFAQGFSYDIMEADVSMNNGIAQTRNFRMTGPSATVLMDGQIDIESETQNLNVVVLPDLNATGGSLIYSLISANPAVGIASLIADYVLKDPISKIFSVEYAVSGPWAAPVVERARRAETSNASTPNNPPSRP